MKAQKLTSTLFYLSAAYDGFLGLAFLIAPGLAFEYFHVPPPNHLGYVQFPAALLIIFALMFYSVARDPLRYKHLIIYGILLKLSYCTVTAVYWLQGALPDMWKPFTICDAIMGILYIWVYFSLGKLRQSAEAA